MFCRVSEKTWNHQHMVLRRPGNARERLTFLQLSATAVFAGIHKAAAL